MNREVYDDYIELILLFGLVAIVLHLYAFARRFFSLPKPGETPPLPPLHFRSVAVVFLIYLGATMLLAPVLARLFTTLHHMRHPATAPPMTLMGWVQIATLAVTFLLFFLYGKTQNASLMKRIWKDRTLPGAQKISEDILSGATCWLLGFPVVVAIGQIADLFLYHFFGVLNYEQVAVRYLKMTLSSPPMLLVALFTILVAAPIIEEFLFRGMLQTYFKQYLGRKKAIVLVSVFFALFHLAPSQGLGNISLIVSLFTFSCYLGFIYEKKGSLFASIGLHSTFNAVSTGRILLFPDS